LFQNGQSGLANSQNGASILTNGTPAAAYTSSNFGPFAVAGAKGGAATEAGDLFCGGGAGTVGNIAGAGGRGAGGGGSVASTAAGGDGLIIIEYTTDLDA